MFLRKPRVAVVVAALVVSGLVAVPAQATTECAPTLTNVEISGERHVVAVFPEGTCTWSVPERVESVDVVVVGGGGGGGGGATFAAGAWPGGGAGGDSFLQSSVPVNAGVVAVNKGPGVKAPQNLRADCHSFNSKHQPLLGTVCTARER